MTEVHESQRLLFEVEVGVTALLEGYSISLQRRRQNFERGYGSKREGVGTGKRKRSFPVV